MYTFYLTVLFLGFSLIFPNMVSADEEKNPFGFFYHEQVERYFFNGKKLFYADGEVLKTGKVGVEVSIDGKEYRPFTSKLRLLNEGRHSIRYRAKDVLGQVLFDKEVEVFLDTSSPKTSLVYSKEIKQVDGVLCVSDPEAISLASYDALSGIKKIEYSQDGTNYLTYDKSKPFLLEGRHKFYYRAIDNVGNAEQANSFRYALSKTPPKTILKIDPEPVKKNDKQYISVNTVFNLESQPSVVPIKETIVNVDGKKFSYTAPFKISRPGDHDLSFYSEDYAANAEQEKEYSLITDDKPAKTETSIEGNVLELGKLKFVGSDFKLRLSTSDDDSGVKEISYRLGKKGEFQAYREPIMLTKDGFQTIFITSVDRVGNKESVWNVSFVSDRTPPKTTVVSGRPFTKAKGKTYSAYPNMLMFQSADNLSGVKSISVSVNGEPFEEYEGAIPLEKKEMNKISFQAVDRLGNKENPQTLELHMIYPGSGIRILSSNKK